MHGANMSTFVRRQVKDGAGGWRLHMVRKPEVIHDYNQYMGGVDLSDQLIAPYNVLLKSMRYISNIKKVNNSDMFLLL